MITLFLADDHTMMREGLRLLLETQPDFKVVGETVNRPEAARAMARHCPDIAILEIVIPELKGLNAISQTHEVCPTTLVIVVSMYAGTEYIARALQTGARGYLLKSSPGSELIEAVRTVQASQVYLCQAISDQVIDHYLDPKAAASESELLARLTPREREVLQLVIEGKPSAQVAAILSLSLNTVDTYRSRLMKKLGINNLPSLVKFAIRQGLTSLEE